MVRGILAVLCLLVVQSIAAGASTIYTSSTDYFANAVNQQAQNFDGSAVADADSVDFGDVVFSCSGTTYCGSNPTTGNNFFGLDNYYVSGGPGNGYSVKFATPDVATFTFVDEISSFGIDIAGLGTKGATALSFSIIGLSGVVFQGYADLNTTFDDALFFGLISDIGFKSITFSGLIGADGIFFDNLSYGIKLQAPPAPVPVPGALPLLASALGLMGSLNWLRRRRAATI